MNSIALRQNTQENLAKRVACKELYSCAKNWVYLEVTFAGIIGVMYIVYTFSDPIFSFLHWKIYQYWFFPFITPITSVVFTLIDNHLIGNKIKSKTEQAAYIQDDFDRNVLELPKNNMITPSFDYVIRVIDKDKSDSFRDWYDVNISKVPIEFGRIIAQKSNCIWDNNLKNDFTHVIGAFMMIIFIIAIIMQFHTYNPKSFTIGLISMLYLLNLFLKYREAYNSSKNNINNLNSKIDSLWNDIIESKDIDNMNRSSQDIQTQLYYHRVNVAFVPDIFYKLRRTKHQDITEVHISKMIDEYTINFESNRDD